MNSKSALSTYQKRNQLMNEPERADADEYLPNCPWNKPEPVLRKYEVTITLATEMQQTIMAIDAEEAGEIACTLANEQCLGLDPEVKETVEIT